MTREKSLDTPWGTTIGSRYARDLENVSGGKVAENVEKKDVRKHKNLANRSTVCYGLDVRVRYTKSSTVKSPSALRLSRHCNANTNVYLEKKSFFDKTRLLVS